MLTELQLTKVHVDLQMAAATTGVDGWGWIRPNHEISRTKAPPFGVKTRVLGRYNFNLDGILEILFLVTKTQW